MMAPSSHRRWQLSPVPWPLFLLSILPLALLLLPLFSLVWRGAAPSLGGEALSSLLVRRALVLSLTTSTLSLLLVLAFGTPVAFLLARYRFRGRKILETVVALPMVLPPAVAGLALLMTFGRKGILGPLLEVTGVSLAFTSAAVVLAQCFVSAPFYIRAARAGFEEIEPELEQVAATLGESSWGVFRRVTVPLAAPSLLGGAVMAWARSLGEFGATIMFAGNFQGRTRTMPLAIYTALESDLGAALALALLLLFVSTVVLALVEVFGARSSGSRQ